MLFTYQIILLNFYFYENYAILVFGYKDSEQ